MRNVQSLKYEVLRQYYSYTWVHLFCGFPPIILMKSQVHLTSRVLFPAIFITYSINFSIPFRHLKKQTPKIMKCRSVESCYAASIYLQS
jgi:hypothetical protein